MKTVQGQQQKIQAPTEREKKMKIQFIEERPNKMKIKTSAEYMADGFTEQELPKIKRFDTLFNFLFCDLNYEQRYSGNHDDLLAEYDDLMKELKL